MMRYLWHRARGHACYQLPRQFSQRYRCETCAWPDRKDPAWMMPLHWGPRGQP